MSYYDLKDILGERLVEMDKLFPPQSKRFILTGVDRVVEDLSDLLSETDASAVETLAVQLDGKVYVFMEDPDDGYRSSLGYTFMPTAHVMQNVFPPIPVVATAIDNTNQTLYQLADAITGEIIVVVGTDYSDSYYPSFVANYNPVGAYFNQPWWKGLGVQVLDITGDWYALVHEINSIHLSSPTASKK